MLAGGKRCSKAENTRDMKSSLILARMVGFTDSLSCKFAHGKVSEKQRNTFINDIKENPAESGILSNVGT